MFNIFNKLLTDKNLQNIQVILKKICWSYQNFYDVKRGHFYKYIRKSNEGRVSVISHSTLKNLLQKCESLPDQMKVFQSYVKLTEDDVSNRYSVRERVENVLKSVCTDCSVHLVGSSVSGLGLKGSDVDLSFRFSNTKEYQNCSVEKNLIANVDVVCGKIPPSEFHLLTKKQQLIFLKEILTKSGIVESSTIIPGHFPILHFGCNGLNCDLSIKNRSAFHGTNLMIFCERLDNRVAPLFRLIVYWAKHFKLIGGPKKFKSYAVFLLVVYFLQTRCPPVLPTVENILHETEFLENLDNWSFNINQHLEKFQPSMNTDTLDKLLRDFFFFYANLNFSPVISTLKGNLIDGQSFLLQNPTFELNTISLQDPLNPNWNVTTGANWKYCKDFIKALLSTCEVYHGYPLQPMSKENWGLTAILDSQFSYQSFTTRENFELEIALANVPNCKDGRIKCLCTASERIFNVLSKALLFQCNKFESETDLTQSFLNKDTLSKRFTKQEYNQSNCNIGIDISPKSQQDSNVFVSRSIYVAANTWFGRSNYYSDNSDVDEKVFINSEQEISTSILKNKKEGDKVDFSFVCECRGVDKDGITYLNVNLKSLNSNVFLPKLGIFLKEYILKYAFKYL